MTAIKTGQAPNIPWWRLQTMSNEEIEKHNNDFMMIENLPESVGIEELPEDIRKALNIEKDITLIIGNVYAKKIWNAAIEAAANSIPTFEDDKMTDVIEIIRKLKK